MTNPIDLNRSDRGFYWFSKAWYNTLTGDDKHNITFGLYCEEGKEGCIGEMSMRWYNLGGKVTPKLECFDDSFAVLASFPDLIYELAKLDNTDFTEEQFVKLLLELGFKDLTQYTQP